MTPDGTTGDRIPTDRSDYMSIAAFTAVAWYNVIELNVQVFLTFKRHRGLYFWSLLISSYGCVLHALGFLLKFFQLTTNNYLSVTIITIGWYAMVTGQAIVLYSRLHLVIRELRILRGILTMIIVDAICFHIPSTILTYGANSSDAQRYTYAFAIAEKLQMTVFSLQEFIISGVYVWGTMKLLKPVYHGRTRKVMMQLIWINLIIIAMDVVLLAMEYSNIYEIEATLKATVYSIKLKLEFAVLNQLMTLANSSVHSHQQLHIEEDEKGNAKPAPGRSKSTEYISPRYKKPDKKYAGSEQNAGGAARKATPTSDTTHSRPGSSNSGIFNKKHFNWLPTLDRDAVVETRPVEKADENDEPNILTNPAACLKSGRQRPADYLSHDRLGGLDVSPELSPTTTANDLTQFEPSRGNRAPPPPNLDLDRADTIMPNGFYRSNRPSVSDWAHGPDSNSEASPDSDEIRLNPYEEDKKPTRPHLGALDARGNMRSRSTGNKGEGLDFMTSALKTPSPKSPDAGTDRPWPLAS